MGKINRTPSWSRTVRRRFHLEALEPRLVLDATGLRLTELMADNDDGIVDFEGNASDWIEIYNPGESPVDLSGLHLTDNANNLGKWQFPAGTAIDAGGYLIVWASGKDGVWGEGEIHTNFALSADGEYLGLVASDGLTVIDSISPKFPRQYEDISYGRSMTDEPSGEVLIEPAHYGYFGTPSPGAPNGVGVYGFTAEPTFSLPHGFYDSQQSVALASLTPGSIVVYTTDGSVPAVDDQMNVVNGTQYTGPIDIVGTTVLRARAFRQGWAPSTLIASSYLFLGDIIHQSPDNAPPEGWPASGVNGQILDYGMDPEIIALYGEQAVKDSLASLSVFSLTFDMPDLFDPDSGIYVNALERGREWERHINVEFIDPANDTGFEVNAGLRIRGGQSRNDFNPKHSFRLSFRGEYGDGKLRFPIFGEDAAQTFDVLDLQTAQNTAWSYETSFRGLQNSFLRDIVSRDLQLHMGHQATRGRFHHLFLNGVYWGIYMTQERVQEDFAASYFGGDPEDYDVIKADAEVRGTAAVEGNDAAWRQLFDYGELLAADPVGNADVYWTMQGLNPDGTRNPTLPVLLDVENLIDYMMIVFYTGGYDIALTAFNGNRNSANWLGIYDHTRQNEGFQFFIHDNELSLGVGQNSLHQHLYIDRTGPFRTSTQSDYAQSNPQFLHQDLLDHPEYKQKFIDRVQLHFFNGGALTYENLVTGFLDRKNQVEGGIIAEATRWGDAKTEIPRTKATWDTEIAWILDTYFPVRGPHVLNQLRNDGLHHTSFSAPSLSQHGGTVPRNYPLVLTSSVGMIYYSLDGSTDPRAIGGAVSDHPSVAVYTQPIELTENVQIKARVLHPNGAWSGLIDVGFDVISLPGDYNRDGTVDTSDYQFWKSQFGQTVTPYADADGNGDGVIDIADFTIWRNHLGQSAPIAAGLTWGAEDVVTQAIEPATGQTASVPETSPALYTRQPAPALKVRLTDEALAPEPEGATREGLFLLPEFSPQEIRSFDPDRPARRKVLETSFNLAAVEEAFSHEGNWSDWRRGALLEFGNSSHLAERERFR